MKVDLFTAAEWMIADAAASHSLAVNNRRLPAIRRVCDDLTRCLDEFDVEEYTPSVDMSSKELCLQFRSMDIITQDGRKHPFFNAISNANHFDFSTVDGENTTTRLWFDDIFADTEKE